MLNQDPLELRLAVWVVVEAAKYMRPGPDDDWPALCFLGAKGVPPETQSDKKGRAQISTVWGCRTPYIKFWQLDGRLSSARRKEKFETDNGVVAAQTSRANALVQMGTPNVKLMRDSWKNVKLQFPAPNFLIRLTNRTFLGG
ncbi:hypothetical protein DAPPUDRAFT_242008 [Daphnia pulex]|uniref:Uncharacterized protein n=1 Tax=Daphnia pulex TaxID=6669 RepID=E9GFL8_DAPPU|nr:hypothetical protein DAPPUDRAFT_242008 [Daphnia pulex]|eukprot:EFX81784.1 hypothetical protein DAPPUDRAFT_242008 [Daphnia pulex]